MTINCIIIEQIKKLGGTYIIFNGDIVTFMFKDQNWTFDKSGLDKPVFDVDIVRGLVQDRLVQICITGESNG